MNIYGREYGFKLTVGASVEISELCPDGNLRRIGEVLEGTVSQTLGTTTAMICAMSKGYEEAKSFESPGYAPNPLTPELLRTLDMQTYQSVTVEALTAFRGDQATTVEVEISKKNEGASAEK